jgi:5'-methylthioinosine phosphorylase
MSGRVGILAAGKFAELVRDRRIEVVPTRYSVDLPVEVGKIAGVDVVFIHRFGWAGRSPDEIDFRVYFAAMRSLKVEAVFTLNGFGAANPEFGLRDWCVPHDILNRTARLCPRYVEEAGYWIRVNMAHPFCEQTRQALIVGLKNSGTTQTIREKAVNACFNGPSIETLADLNAAVKAGGDLASTLGYPEADLARKALLRYGSLCWTSDIASHMSVLKWTGPSIEEVDAIFEQVVPRLAETSWCDDENICGCQHEASQVWEKAGATPPTW